MENDKLITISSAVDGAISVRAKSINLSREWVRKGAIQKIAWGDLEQIFYEQGFEYLIKTGALYIEDAEARQYLGLEPEGAKPEEQMIKTSDEFLKKLFDLNQMNFEQFKEVLDRMTYDQLRETIHYVVENKITDYSRCQVLEKKTGLKVFEAVQNRIAYDNESDQ